MWLLDKTFLVWHLALGAALLGVGWLGLGPARPAFRFWSTACSCAWCGCCTSPGLVNSASHIWGYRNYPTQDDSRNFWWVGLLANGEGWHNNHHAFPGRARHGHRWWELDATFATICVLERLGLAWNVQRGD